jgi:formylglycine-generating enzyme required for sulfatase activity
MKKVRYLMFVFTIASAFLLQSCGTPTPVVIVVTATPAPPTETVIEPTAALAPVTLAGPQTGTTLKWVDGSTLAYVPLSEFIMGNDTFNAPVHNVTLDEYWIYNTKVTNRMYAQCVALGACTSPSQELGGPVYSNPEYANHPVVGVTWDQAQTYCAWAGGQLPTEAQWEKAARGLDGAKYPWGNADPACEILNYAYCNGSTSDVGAFKDGISPYGLYDMAGNVFEWTSDWYGESYYKESPAANPTGPESGEFRVTRGSSFETYPDQVESAVRHFTVGKNHRRDIGFRCVVPNPQPYAPYCQTPSFIPTGMISSNDCQLPTAELRGIYCAGGNSFATVDISPGSVFESEEDLKCTEAIIDGQRRLTCMGPKFVESTHELTVCNPTCSTSPDLTGATPACDPGYTLDEANHVCNYTPIVGQVSVAGCPAGYKILDRGGQQVCAISVNANGQCPAGLYLDTLSNLCAPPVSSFDTPYGIDNPGLAAQLYAGCPAGYTYSDTFQCCQAVQGGTYPGCAPGTKLDPSVGACSPGRIHLSGPGCVALEVTTIRCEMPFNPCPTIDNETRCIQTPQCRWDEKQGCILR